jgi:YidC/Oxa1 family membrane protein insertase
VRGFYNYSHGVRFPIATPLQPLVDLEQNVLEALHSIGLGWGLAIVGMTVLVRLAIVPITVRQFKAQRRLASHMGNIKALKDRHGDDRDRLREETMAYYKEHSVNPLGAFLPLLIQIPIFLSLYALMRQDVKSGIFGHASFLFIPDLTSSAHGAVLVTLVLCYVTSQLAGSLIATRTMQKGQRGLMVALPLLFVGVATRFPAGLLVYWITSSVWSLGQQLVLWRVRTAMPPLPEAALTVEPPEVAPPAPKARQHPRSKKRKRRRQKR